MGKKRAVPCSVSRSSSSDDDRGRGSGQGNRRGFQKRGRAPPKAPVGARSRPAKEGEGNFEGLFEDFSDCLHRINDARSDSLKIGSQELWVDKYKPCSLSDLAVHRKKVEEIKKWLEERLVMSKNVNGNNALLITGQCGSGKSATVHVLANVFGAQLCEWVTPTPTLWREHLYNSYSGIRYMSKLDEFELFIEQLKKYRPLSTTCEKSSKERIIFLIDDLPVTNGRIASERLRKCLDILVRSAPVPTLILITEFAKNDTSNDNTKQSGIGEGLDVFLQRVGAYKVSFNPITVNSTRKTLLRICRAEAQAVSEEWINLIAKASGGDIRHAITSLQYFCLNRAQFFSLSKPNLSPHLNDISPSFTLAGSGSDCTMSFGRDETLSFFHALGKFLHNKREDEHVCEKNLFFLKEQYTRLPSKIEDPEKALTQVHGQARSVTDFLHENVFDFISDEGMHEAWTVASYLSDADCLLFMGTRPMLSRMVTWKYEPEHLTQLIAASVAVRGVLFGNSRPSSSRWHSMRTPVLWQVDQSSRVNKNDLLLERIRNSRNLWSTCTAVLATEYRPAARWLGSRTLDDACIIEPLRHQMSEGDCSDLSKLSNAEGSCSESEEDEIEEW